MANHKSAKKRIEITERNRLRNRLYKSSVRTLIKKFLVDLENSKSLKTPEQKEKLNQALRLIYSVLDKATKKHVFHKNKAARKKSQLASRLKNF